MNDSDQPIIGKSVEEIESESGNRVNSPLEGEAHRDAADTVLVPAVNSPGTGLTGAGVAGPGMMGGLPGILGTELVNNGLVDDDLTGNRAGSGDSAGSGNRAGSEDGRGGKKSDGE